MLHVVCSRARLGFKLDKYCINELEFWNDNIIKGNVRYCFSATTPNCFVYSDASGTGCGANMTLNQEYICHTMWSENERMKSSTCRELYAIEFALRLFCGKLKDSRVKWFTDNRAAAKISEAGSMMYTISNVLLCVFSRFALRIRSHWIFNGFLAMKLQKLTSLVVLLMLTTGRFRVPCFCSSKDCGVHTRWIVLKIIIISKYLVFSLDFGLLGELEYIFSFNS